MKIFLAIFTISFCLITLNADKKKSPKPTSEDITEKNATACEITLNQTATLIEPALLVGYQEWPSTLEEIDKHCDLGAKVYKSIRRYGRCTTGLSRQSLNIFLRGLKKFMQNICSSNKRKQETADILKCASNGTNAGWSKCLKETNSRLDITSTNASDPAMVGNICCAYSSLVNCINTNTGTKSECDKSKDTTFFLQSSMALVIKDLTDLLCTNYESKESCEIHDSQRSDILQSIAEGKHVFKGAFLMTPLIKAASQLGKIHADDI